MDVIITENGEGLSVTLTVANQLGLHARPAAKLAQEAQRFEAEITLEADGMEIDAKSILDILSLAAPKGCEIVIKGQGSDAREALMHLVQAFENKFGEES